MSEKLHILHQPQDADLVADLVERIQRLIPGSTITCAGLPGYEAPGGRGLDDAGAVIGVLTAQAMAGGSVCFEMGMARAHGKTVAAVRSGLPPDALDLPLPGYLFADLNDAGALVGLLRELAEVLDLTFTTELEVEQAEASDGPPAASNAADIRTSSTVVLGGATANEASDAVPEHEVRYQPPVSEETQPRWSRPPGMLAVAADSAVESPVDLPEKAGAEAQADAEPNPTAGGAEITPPENEQPQEASTSSGSTNVAPPVAAPRPNFSARPPLAVPPPASVIPSALSQSPPVARPSHRVERSMEVVTPHATAVSQDSAARTDDDVVMQPRAGVQASAGLDYGNTQAHPESFEAGFAAGRVFGQVSFDADGRSAVASQLDATFGTFMTALGADWITLRELEDVDLWSETAENLLAALPDERAVLADWYAAGLRIAALLQVAALPLEPGTSEDIDDLWAQNMESLLALLECLHLGVGPTAVLEGLLENLRSAENGAADAAQLDALMLAHARQADQDTGARVESL